MNNPLGPVGTIVPRDQNFDLGPMVLGYDGSVPVTVAFKTSAETATQRGRRNASIFLTPIFESTSTAAEAKNSRSFEAVRKMLQDLKHGHIPINFADRTCAVLEDPGSIAAAMYYRATKPFRKELMKGIFARIERAQRPNPDSRVMLVDDVDALGMKKVALDWRITDEDYNSLYQTAVAFARGIGAAGFGRMMLEIEASKDLSKITGTGHHLGTTRMHNDSRYGVVDAELSSAWPR